MNYIIKGNNNKFKLIALHSKMTHAIETHTHGALSLNKTWNESVFVNCVSINIQHPLCSSINQAHRESFFSG